MPDLSTNSSIKSETLEIVHVLEAFAQRSDVNAKIISAVEDVLHDLQSNTFQDSAAIGVNLSELSDVPCFLGTLRIAGFRAGFKAQNEVHPNSDQFTLSLSGWGSTIVEIGDVKRTDTYGDGKGNNLSGKWHAAPREQFHQHIAGDCGIWIVAAFHTASDVITKYQ